jgi:hypothetical protein
MDFLQTISLSRCRRQQKTDQHCARNATRHVALPSAFELL